MDPPIYPGELMRRLVLTALTAQPQPGDQADADQVHMPAIFCACGLWGRACCMDCSCCLQRAWLEGKGLTVMWRVLLNSMWQAGCTRSNQDHASCLQHQRLPGHGRQLTS